MKDLPTSFAKNFYTFVIVVLSQTLFSQSISKPTFVFTSACASSGFNTYPVNFNFAPVSSFSAGNTFYLQLSDASGNFSNLTEVASLSSITASPGQLIFVVPTNFIGGEGYRFRIRSSSPALLSPESNAVPIYFKSFNNNFFINNQLPTAKYCVGSSLVLSIDNTAATSPLTFINLVYRWYRNNTIIAGATSVSYNVNSAGTYYCEINYGSCSPLSAITRSQDVLVSAVAGLPTITATSSLGTAIEVGKPTTLSVVQNSNYAYQWFKDGIPIPGATSFDYVTDQAGQYYVNVNNTNCVVQSNGITIVNVVITPTSTVIPNVISPNNDLINDTWVIPSQYGSGSNTEIIITDANGKEVLKTKNYTNDWPTTAIDYQSAAPVFYYIIIPTNQETRKGTITVIK